MHKEGVQKDSQRHSVKRPQWMKITTLPMLDHKLASPTQCRDIISRVNKPTSPSPISMLFPITLISPCFLDAMSMLSSVKTSWKHQVHPQVHLQSTISCNHCHLTR